jgi:hypothetical protein
VLDPVDVGPVGHDQDRLGGGAIPERIEIAAEQ